MYFPYHIVKVQEVTDGGWELSSCDVDTMRKERKSHSDQSYPGSLPRSGIHVDGFSQI